MFRWLPDSDGRVYETKLKNRYRYGVFYTGGRCILFPEVCEFDRTIMWYAPTEKEILSTNDDEIISAYKKIDERNKIDRPGKRFFHKEVIKEVNWKCQKDTGDFDG